jgi:DNA polymerase
VEAFDRGDDVYKIMASAIYNKPKEEITKDERFVGKTTILGAGYGMGANKFKAQLATFGVDLSQEECDRIIRVYRETYPNIPKLWRAAGNALEGLMQGRAQDIGKEGILVVDAETGIKLPNGLHIKYPNLRKEVNEEDGRKELVYDTKRGRATIPNRIYGGKVIENVCQALARIVIGEQLLRVAKRYKVVMTVHDAIGCIAPLAEIERAMEYVEYCMRIRPEWAPDLPLDCEGGYANSYGEC